MELPTGKLRTVRLRTMLTDGNLTAVETDELKEGDEVVLSEMTDYAHLTRVGVKGRKGRTR